MVFVNDKKYACETCIKGHRSSTCNHTDRPLFEIKKKGRPATQCEHCRELRKTKQVHIKCVCEGREDAERLVMSYSIPAKKANRKGLLASAAFPHGLTELVGTSASSEEVVKRKTDIPCTCLAGGECRCFGPRRIAKARAASDGALPDKVQGSFEHEQNNASIASDTPTSPHMAYTQNGHDDSMMFSEDSMSMPDVAQFNTAGFDANQFDVINQGYIGYDQNNYDGRGNVSGPYEGSVTSPIGSMSGSMQSSPLDSFPSDNTVEWIPNEDMSSSTLQSLCECGDHCRCPGCMQHGDPSSLGQYMTPADTCVNPNTCVACLSCIFLNPTTPFGEGALTTLEQGQSQTYDSSDSVDDWLRQVIAESPASYPPMTGSTANGPLSMTLTEQELWELLNNNGPINTNSTPFLTQSSSSSSIVSQYNQPNNLQENNYIANIRRASDGIDFSFHAPTPISSNQMLPIVAAPGTANQSQNNLNVPSNSSVSRSPSSGSQSSGRSASGTCRAPKPRPIVHIRPIAPNGPLPLNRPPPLSPLPPYGHRSSSPRSAGSSTAGRISMTSASASSSASVRSTASVSPDSAAVHEFSSMKM